MGFLLLSAQGIESGPKRTDRIRGLLWVRCRIVLVFSQKTALGSENCHSQHGIVRNLARPVSDPRVDLAFGAPGLAARFLTTDATGRKGGSRPQAAHLPNDNPPLTGSLSQG